MPEANIEILRANAYAKLSEAEKAMYAYAAALPLGDERTKAYEVFENVRNAARVGH